ncbi:MAG: indolepyruvate oxidoreductase subunit beta [Firmicutes bacterium]|nr:indolepyruvate oxidoreductase subunit beta [Dethiobacter sp.]MBS3887900.1 indolepyruvate oxidoreductase subunit beta [Bacillota bacterium]MBS4053855.1 indolepyruvate oxidoreductase subunit beta [Thermaerobacter sp.]MBS4054260.1 indolepyruvate oxidoreductase subunit beta [Thermaerobacter sp.]
MKTLNILLVGVGGQGTILASKILAEVAMMQGLDVKMSEIHGMAQRGGSVVTQVRMGEKIYGPVIDEGEADFIVAFEKLEALRWIHYLRPGGVVVVNNQQIDPMTVITGQFVYPPEILDTLLERADDVNILDALQLAREAGSAKTVNVVLLGALARKMEIPKEDWHEAIRRTVAPAFLALNMAAFSAGLKEA